ncbi:PDC sensor domain-containing protein [Azorhizophilus paspali]|uniref:PDC sensor domain-containing protein n=1 Tax=Azorhizophilus paspali TaxID=69963 RepID=A0ABV6SMU8_AZOPA
MRLPWVLATSPESLGLLGRTVDNTGVREVLEKRRPPISAPYISAKNRLVVFISQPIFADNGTHQGYIGGSIHLQHGNILHTLLGEHFH